MKTIKIKNNNNNSSIESNIIVTKDNTYIPMQDLSKVLGKGMVFDEEENIMRIAKGEYMTWFDFVDIFNDNKKLFYDAITLFKKHQKYEIGRQSLDINFSEGNIDKYVKNKEVKDIMLKLNSNCNVSEISFKYWVIYQI